MLRSWESEILGRSESEILESQVGYVTSNSATLGNTGRNMALGLRLVGHPVLVKAIIW